MNSFLEGLKRIPFLKFVKPVLIDPFDNHALEAENVGAAKCKASKDTDQNFKDTNQTEVLTM